MISIIIVNYNVYNEIIECVTSIKNNMQDVDYEVIVVDNNSTDRSIENINNVFPEVKFIPLDTNKGFGYANNTGMKIALGKYFLLINPDILIEDDSIEKMVHYLDEKDEVGVVGPVLVKPDKNYERYYTLFPSLYSRFMQEFGYYMTAPKMKRRFYEFWDANINKGIPFEVDWVMGACMMIRKEIFAYTKGFDEVFFLYEEETEWQYRISQAGWRRIILPDSKVIHNYNSSVGKIGSLFREYHEYRSRIIFSAKHDKGIKWYIRYSMIYLNLKLRILRNKFRYFIFKDIIYKKKVDIPKNLINFLKKKRSQILSSNYDSKIENKLFELT